MKLNPGGKIIEVKEGKPFALDRAIRKNSIGDILIQIKSETDNGCLILEHGMPTNFVYEPQGANQIVGIEAFSKLYELAEKRNSELLIRESNTPEGFEKQHPGSSLCETNYY